MAGIYPNTVTGTTGASANLDGTSPRKYSAQETIQVNKYKYKYKCNTKYGILTVSRQLQV